PLVFGLILKEVQDECEKKAEVYILKPFLTIKLSTKKKRTQNISIGMNNAFVKATTKNLNFID
ncbi:9719_t:CDS:1, partial [Gigaspora margarita]